MKYFSLLAAIFLGILCASYAAPKPPVTPLIIPPGPPSLTLPPFNPGDPAVITGRGSISGAVYLVQTTTNIDDSSSWITIGSVTNGLDGTFSFTDVDAPNYPFRFYRLAVP